MKRTKQQFASVQRDQQQQHQQKSLEQNEKWKISRWAGFPPCRTEMFWAKVKTVSDERMDYEPCRTARMPMSELTWIARIHQWHDVLCVCWVHMSKLIMSMTANGSLTHFFLLKWWAASWSWWSHIVHRDITPDWARWKTKHRMRQCDFLGIQWSYCK